MMYNILLESLLSSSNTFVATVEFVVVGVVVSAKSCCTFEMVALMALEMSATEPFTIETNMFFFMMALDDPGGDCK